MSWDCRIRVKCTACERIYEWEASSSEGNIINYNEGDTIKGVECNRYWQYQNECRNKRFKVLVIMFI